MKRNRSAAALFLATIGGSALALHSDLAIGHGGGLDQFGCHTESATGEYHCHRDSSPPDPEPPSFGGGGGSGGGGGGGGGDRFGENDPDNVTAPCAAIPIEDRVTHVRDGDTIEVGGLPIRILGIAAPELSEPGGAEAKRKMERVVRRKVLWCELTGNATFDRCEASCYFGVKDLAAVMVKTGHALDCPSYSRGRYARLEKPRSRIMRIYDRPDYCN